MQQTDFKTSVGISACMLESAEQGDAKAQANFGDAYYSGEGVSKTTNYLLNGIGCP